MVDGLEVKKLPSRDVAYEEDERRSSDPDRRQPNHSLTPSEHIPFVQHHPRIQPSVDACVPLCNSCTVNPKMVLKDLHPQLPTILRAGIGPMGGARERRSWMERYDLWNGWVGIVFVWFSLYTAKDQVCTSTHHIMGGRMTPRGALGFMDGTLENQKDYYKKVRKALEREPWWWSRGGDGDEEMGGTADRHRGGCCPRRSESEVGEQKVGEQRLYA